MVVVGGRVCVGENENKDNAGSRHLSTIIHLRRRLAADIVSFYISKAAVTPNKLSEKVPPRIRSSGLLFGTGVCV